MTKKKVIHYINQFYGQIGGEEKADQTPIFQDGAVGPGKVLSDLLGEDIEIIATIICGDSYFAENQETALNEIIKMVDSYKPDGFIAGPAFNAGRYGLACGTVAAEVKKKFDIPVLSAMYPENPGAEMFSKYIYILKNDISAVGMRKTLPNMAKFMIKLFNNEEIGFPEEEGYIPQGFRVNVWMEKNGAERGVDMLLKKLKGEPFITELPMPVFNRVPPAPAIDAIKSAKIALVTSGGIVPAGNPDRIESANASRYGKYDINGIDDLTSDKFITVHGGYDPVYALEDPDRVLPLDAMRILEGEGKIGSLFNYFYATVGNTTAVSNALKYGEAIAKDMLENGVTGAILTST
jgi:glycine reductase complex component B subunit gamma